MNLYANKDNKNLIETIERKVEDYSWGILRFTKEENDFIYSLPYVCSCEICYGQSYYLKVCDCLAVFNLCQVCMIEGLITKCPDCGANWVEPLLPRVCADVNSQKRPYIKECVQCDKRQVCMYGIEITKEDLDSVFGSKPYKTSSIWKKVAL